MNKNSSHTSQSGIALTAIIIIIVAILAIGGGAAYFLTDGFGTNKSNGSSNNSKTDSSNDDDGNNNNQNKQQSNKSATGTDTLPLVKAAVEGRATVKCVSNTKVDDKYAVATMYIKDKDNIRLNIRSDMGTLNTLLKDQAYSYTWSEGQDRGTKFATSNDTRNIEEQWKENLEDAENNSNLQGISCEQIAVSDELFVIPKNITFSDASRYSS